MNEGERFRSSPIMARILLAIVASVVTILLAEGAISAVTGSSLLRQDDGTAQRRGDRLASDDTRIRASAGIAGQLRGHVDPLVGSMLRAGEGLETLGARYSADVMGIRRRSSPAVSDPAVRILVLGDSVAFGTGVNDDETIAEQLELLLNEVRGPQAGSVECRTIGTPGWNHRNSVHFMIDHLAALQPDIVIFLPVNNDLTDTFSVTEGGHRSLSPDPVSKDPWLSVHDEPLIAFLANKVSEMQSGGVGLERKVNPGPKVLTAGLTGLSTRRYEENADSIALLARIIDQQGGRVAIAFLAEWDYTWLLRKALLDQQVGIPDIPLFVEVPPAYHLNGDPHPNPEGIRLIAMWIARSLLDMGWVDRGNGSSIPAAPEGASDLRAALPRGGRVRVRASQIRGESMRKLESAVDFGTGQGIHQIYGGVNQDGSVSSRLAVVLNAASGLRIKVLPEINAAHIYPLGVVVKVDDVIVGRLEVPKEGSVEQHFALPAHVKRNSAIEVCLVPELWAVTLVRGRSQVTSLWVEWIRSE